MVRKTLVKGRGGPIQTLPEKLRETAGTIREDIECLDGVLEDFRDGKLKIEE